MPNYVQDNDRTIIDAFGGSGSKGQKPGPLTDQHFDRAIAASQHSMSKAPHYVVIGSLVGNVGFFLGSSASFASNAAAVNSTTTTLTASSYYTDFGALASGTTLHINPHAWSGSIGDVVTFVYKGGLDGMGRP